MKITLTPSQRDFALAILTALKNNHKAVLTPPRSGKTLLFHNLENYLGREHKDYTIEDFEKFLETSGSLPNSSKPFAPKIVSPGARYMHDAYGITEVRRLLLTRQMEDVFVSVATGTCVWSMHGMMEEIAKLADTAEEYTYLVVIHIIWLERNQRASIFTE